MTGGARVPVTGGVRVPVMGSVRVPVMGGASGKQGEGKRCWEAGAL